VFQTVIQYVFFYLGLAYTTGVKGTITSGSGAFFAVLVASLIFKQEKLTVKKILACLIGFAGIVIINFNGLSFTSDILDFLGVVFVLLSTVSNSLSSVLIKKFSASESPVVISGYQFIVGGIFMIIVGLAFGGKITVSDLGGIAILLYLALLSALAYSLWGILLKHNPVSSVTVFNFTTPIFGTLLTLIFLPEENSALAPFNVAVTLALVAIGIFMLNYVPKSRQKLK
jgi:drug/metabolite transporter (DMT)-like permease